MRNYSAYSRSAGPIEGAVLIFANTAKEAKRMASQDGVVWDICGGEFTDIAVKWIRDDLAYLADPKLAGEPHVVDSPTVCLDCEMWGCSITVSEIDNSVTCEECEQYPGDELASKYVDYIQAKEPDA